MKQKTTATAGRQSFSHRNPWKSFQGAEGGGTSWSQSTARPGWKYSLKVKQRSSATPRLHSRAGRFEGWYCSLFFPRLPSTLLLRTADRYGYFIWEKPILVNSLVQARPWFINKNKNSNNNRMFSQSKILIFLIKAVKIKSKLHYNKLENLQQLYSSKLILCQHRQELVLKQGLVLPALL